MEAWFPALLALGEFRTWLSPSTSCAAGFSSSFILLVVWATFWLGFLSGAAVVTVFLCPSARELLSSVCRQCSFLLNPRSEEDLQERVHQRLQRYRLR